ncbi:VOC family protein [Streptomyces tanashiensis]
MIAELQCVVLDCAVPRELSAFYRAVLGGDVDRPDPRWSLGASWSTLHTPGGLVLCFQGVADFRPPAGRTRSAPSSSTSTSTSPIWTRPTSRSSRTARPRSTTRAAELAGDADPAGHPFCLVRH